MKILAGGAIFVRAIATFLVAMAAWSAAAAAPEEVATLLPQAQSVGQARMRYWGLHIYDAQLWASAGFAPEQWSGQPLALELRYARALRGADIAQRSVLEMRRQPNYPSAREVEWLDRLRSLLPDVREGDRLLGVLQPGQGVVFFLNGHAIGEIRDGLFASLFFGIWLAPQTSEPQMRSALLGLAP